MTIKAVYQNRVFRPLQPVDLPELTEVGILLPAASAESADFAENEKARKEIYEILSRSYDTDDPTLAERHNEHQP